MALLLTSAAVALLVAAAALVAARVSRRPVEVGLVDGHLRPCPGTPNCVTSEGPGASVEPLAFRGDPAEALAALAALVASQRGARVVEQDDAYVHAVYLTPLFGFADDLELCLAAREGVVHVRCASRVGHSDLGANRRRVESLRRLWGEATARSGRGDAAR